MHFRAFSQTHGGDHACKSARLMPPSSSNLSPGSDARRGANEVVHDDAPVMIGIDS